MSDKDAANVLNRLTLRVIAIEENKTHCCRVCGKLGKIRDMVHVNAHSQMADDYDKEHPISAAARSRHEEHEPELADDCYCRYHIHPECVPSTCFERRKKPKVKSGGV